MSDRNKKCPECGSTAVYFFRDDLDECRECRHIWKVDGSGNPVGREGLTE